MSYNVDELLMNSYSFWIPKNAVILPLLSKGIFAGYRIEG
jgi:hypothetical protein